MNRLNGLIEKFTTTLCLHRNKKGLSEQEKSTKKLVEIFFNNTDVVEHQLFPYLNFFDLKQVKLVNKNLNNQTSLVKACIKQGDKKEFPKLILFLFQNKNNKVFKEAVGIIFSNKYIHLQKPLFQLIKKNDDESEKLESESNSLFNLVIKSLPTSITSLNLSKSRITDEGLAHLSQLKSLKILNISYCINITYIGCEDLLELKGILKKVNISYCKNISCIGIRYIEALHPNSMRYGGCKPTEHVHIERSQPSISESS